MSMLVQHNLLAMNAGRQLGLVQNVQKKSSEKLSSGYRVNRSADDACGLAISEKMRRQIRGLNQGTKNMQDAVSLCQVADGALVETQDILQRMNELCIQAANGTNSLSDRTAIQEEIDQLTMEVDRIAMTTSFNEFIHPLYDRSAIEHATDYAPGREVSYTVLEPIYGEEDEWLQYGDFYVSTRGVEGVDFTYDAQNREFTILSDKGIKITTKGNVTTQDHIVVKSGVSANVLLEDCKIDVSGRSGVAAFKIEDDSTGNVTVGLQGENYFKSGANCAGLQKNGYADNVGKLTLQGSGSLLTYGGSGGAAGGAGIGAGGAQSTRNIKIIGVSIYAVGRGAAGIGGSATRALSGNHGNCRDVEIIGGNVTSFGDDDCAGIGGGYHGEGVNIRISGGYVRACAWSGGGRRLVGDAIGSGAPNRPMSSTWDNPQGFAKQPASVYIDGVMYTGRYETWTVSGLGKNLFARPESDPVSNVLPQLKFGSVTDAQYTGNGVNQYMHFTYGTAPVPLEDAPEYRTVVKTKREEGGIVSTPETRGRLWIHMGPDAKDGVELYLVNATATRLGIQGLRVLSVDEYNEYDNQGNVISSVNEPLGAIDKIAKAIKTVSSYRSYFGAMQNRFESAMRENDNTAENLTYSESHIRDTDMALEMVSFSKSQIVSGVAQSMLAQANQTNAGVLQLLSSVA